MRPIRALVLALAVMVTAIGPGTVTPAQAHEDVCTGNFWVQFDSRYSDSSFGYPNVSPRNVSDFWLGMPLGLCAVSFQLSGVGWMIGDCHLASGYGYTNYGHRYDVEWLGDTLTFTGGLVGTVHALVDPFVYRNSCLDGTAWHLLLTGTLVSVHVP